MLVILRSRSGSLLLVGFWILAVGVGMRALLLHAATPGRKGEAPGRWPEGVARQAGRPTLVMAVHPRCPCSRASVGELSRIMTLCRGRTAARVLFVKPAGFGREWVRTDLWDSAAEIPGVEVVCDDEGVMARRFGARTSGDTLLFGAGGELLFHGGITGSRGHWGDNAGRSAVVSLLAVENRPAAGRTACVDSLVFGCPLFDPGAD
jgi:hypothetical protein